MARPRASDFERRVLHVLRGLRAGDVVTYGEVAAEAGHPGAARAVGNILACSDGVPWWRVVSASGRLVRGHEREHARRLRADGVLVEGGRITRAPGARPPVARRSRSGRLPLDGRG